MLSAKNIHFAYKGRPILDGLDLEVREGELIGLVGPNGSGKTTLLRLITGALRPARGRIRIDGADLATLSPSKRARLVSIVPQNPQLPLSFSALDLVMMGRNPHLKLLQREGRHDLEIAIRSMELTETDHLADRTLGTLSGGELQRVVVAMSLAQEPTLLLLDEPTSNLDLSHQTKVLDMVVDLQRQRSVGVLVAMHDLTLAAQYCDRLVLLADGRSYAEGPPREVLTAENISKVYGADVYVIPHPVSGTPVVVGARGTGHGVQVV